MPEKLSNRFTLKILKNSILTRLIKDFMCKQCNALKIALDSKFCKKNCIAEIRDNAEKQDGYLYLETAQIAYFGESEPLFRSK